MRVKTAVVGAAGRMGRALVQEVVADDALQLVAAAEAAGAAAIGQDAGSIAGLAQQKVSISDDLSAVVQAADAVIDFTAPQVTAQVAALCAEHATALVAGTTALDEHQQAALRQAGMKVPVVWAPNMSVGVNVLLQLVDRAARLLGPGYDLEVIESHHRHKKDAPSGTAKRLAEVLATATAEQGELEQRARHGRQGLQPRSPAEIGIHAVRAGDIVGEHTVLYCCDGERIELTHRASTRQTFTRGAARAVRWVYGRAAGLYDMLDVLGIRAHDR